MRFLLKRREQPWKSLVFVFFIFFLVWLLLQILAPLMLPPGSVPDLSGSAGLSDNEQAIQNISIPWNIVYTAGDRLCHQKLERSFIVNGNQMPFCSRCIGIFAGSTLGIGLMLFFRLPLDEKFLFFILIGIAPLAVDGIGQLFGLWESTNVIRVLTGLLAGGLTGIAIGAIIDEIKDMLAEKKKEKRS